MKVVLVLWGTTVDSGDEFAGFYTAITNSAYIDWLSEYDTPTTSIGRGTLIANYTDASAAIGDLAGSDVETELTRLIDAGSIPFPDANTAYAIHFSPGVTVSFDGYETCKSICGYHSTYDHDGRNVNYSVVPDETGAAAPLGCGSGSKFENTCETASHELLEMITDPAVGLATGIASPLAWYNAQKGEIADICDVPNIRAGLIAGYTVQPAWSNLAGACIVSRP